MPLSKPLRGIKLNISHPLARVLVHCWLENEGMGNVIYDSCNRLNLTGYGTTGLPAWTAGNHGAALSYVAANKQYHETDTPPKITAYPFSVVAWFNTNNISIAQRLFFFGDKDTDNTYQALRLSTTGYVYAESRNTVAVAAISTMAVTANTWNMAAGVWTSATLRAAYLNAGSKGTNTTSSTFSSAHDRTSIGHQGTLTPSSPMSGKIGLVMVWNRALTDAEIARLYSEPYAMFEPGIRPIILGAAA
jgi:hypothetical protein